MGEATPDDADSISDLARETGEHAVPDHSDASFADESSAASESPEAPGPRAGGRVGRIARVVVPAALIAIAAPFAVNGLASAVNETVPTSTTATTPASTSTVVQDPAAAETTTIPTAVAAIAEPVVEVVVGASTTVAHDHGSDDTSASAATAGADTGEGGHSHGAVTPEVALTRTERADLAAQLLIARAAADRFPTVAAAEAGGYQLVTGYLPLIGAHYINWGLMDGTFDPGAPEMLLFDGTEPTSSIVGLSYYLFSDVEPSPFVGGNDHWHQHIGLCLRDGVVVGGESTTVEECAARGGAKAGAQNGWMVHAWVVPGWESPQGVFSPEHPGLTADLPTS